MLDYLHIITLPPSFSPPASANTHTHNNANVALSLMLKRRLGGIVHILTQGNTPLYYEEELRRLMSHQAPLIQASLTFAPVEDRHALCRIELSSVTLMAADAMHHHHDWGSAEPFSLCARNAINPLLICGQVYITLALTLLCFLPTHTIIFPHTLSHNTTSHTP